MRHLRAVLIFPVLVLAILFTAGTASADKSSVAIKAPAEVPPGTEVSIQVTTTHSANNMLHYTDWVTVTVNGKEAARWSYTASERPPAEVFTKEVKVVATEDLDIKAQANCNLHGSAGPASAKVVVKK